MENQVKITKENAIASVQNSMSSIFSKEDVLFLINSIEEKKEEVKTTLSVDKLEELVTIITSEIEDQHDKGRIIDVDSAEFELYGNRIELCSVPLDLEVIEDIVRGALTDAFEPESEEDEEDKEE
jgi:hypothetical protein